MILTKSDYLSHGLVLITICMFILFSSCDRDEGRHSDKSNIILFLVDDMGLMDT